MANLDTAAKRRAATQFMPWMIMPDADGTIGDADRVQAAGVYSGISIGAALSTVDSNLQIMSMMISQKLAMSISVKGQCLPIELLVNAPTGAPPSGRGIVAYISGSFLKFAAWNGSAWITTG